MTWVLVAVAAWLALSVVAAVLIGRVIRLSDRMDAARRQAPTEHSILAVCVDTEPHLRIPTVPAPAVAPRIERIRRTASRRD